MLKDKEADLVALIDPFEPGEAREKVRVALVSRRLIATDAVMHTVAYGAKFDVFSLRGVRVRVSVPTVYFVSKKT